MKVQRFSNYIAEKMDFNSLESKMDPSYIELKKGLIEMIKTTLQATKEANLTMIDVEDFISDYVSSGKDSNTIDKLIEDNDIFNFYLKFQSDVDELLNDKKYMTESPHSHNVFSLYDVVIDGTKQAILESLQIIQKEISNK